jgi:hypothetical protein
VTLLNRMRQFVSQEVSSVIAAGRVLTAREDNVRTGSVSERTDALRRPGGTVVGVDAHLREIPPEARLEERAGRPVEVFAGRAEYLMHDGRRPSA